MDPHIAFNETVSNGSTVMRTTISSLREDFASKWLLFTFLALNTTVAASLYIAARLENLKAANVSTLSQKKASGVKLTASEPSAPEKTSEGRAAQATSSSKKKTPACTSIAHRPGECRGFEGHLAWRDVNVDMDIRDRSMSEWLNRRQQVALQKIGTCAVVTAGLTILEVSVGLWIGSLALVSNGVHLITDVAMYMCLYVAVTAASQGTANRRYTFGLHRLEVVGVLIAMTAQYLTMFQLQIAAISRLWTPHIVEGKFVFIVASCSLMVNTSLALWVGKAANSCAHGHNHGGMASHMARLHLISDAVQNGIVILTGGLLWIDPKLYIMDPLCTFAFGALMITNSGGFLKRLLGVVMEAAPEDLDFEQMFADLANITNVIDVHCCHAWALAPGKNAVSAHLHIADGAHEEVLHEAQVILRHRYGIHHMTLQISDDEDLA